MTEKFNQKVLLRHLTAILGRNHVSTDPQQRLRCSQDMMSKNFLERKAGDPPHLPDLVCWPKNTKEVRAVLRLASSRKIPVVPYGGGSGVSGGILPVLGGITLNLQRMRKIGKIDERGGTHPYSVVVESGVIGQSLEDELNRRGFTLGHFPSSIKMATVGGYLACRSAGQLSSRYGKIEDMVEDIEVVLANGEVIPLGGSIRPYPNIRPKDLLIGTEGCLGVITRARLRIHPKAPAARYRGVSFNRLENGLQAMREIMQSGLRPSVLRLYDPLDTLLLNYGYDKIPVKIPLPVEAVKTGIQQFIFEHPLWIQRFVNLLPTEVTMILGFEGDPALVKIQEQSALKICKKSISKDLGEKPGLHWLRHRYGVADKMPKVFAMDAFVDTIEVATTWDKLSSLYTKIKRVLTPEVLVLAHFSHAYPEGCSIYFTFLGRKGSAKKDIKTYEQVWNEAMTACLKAGGSISHHHGIGLLKARFLPQELNGAMPFYHQIKKKLDPHHIMNPGKMGL